MARRRKAGGMKNIPPAWPPELEISSSPRELYEPMLRLYPDRANPGSRRSGANAAKEPKP
jgi:hypothetical protein